LGYLGSPTAELAEGDRCWRRHPLALTVALIDRIETLEQQSASVAGEVASFG
jgi:hypothetical protein